MAKWYVCGLPLTDRLHVHASTDPKFHIEMDMTTTEMPEAWQYFMSSTGASIKLKAGVFGSQSACDKDTDLYF